MATLRQASQGDDLAAIRNATDELQKASHKMAEALYRQSGTPGAGATGEPAGPAGAGNPETPGGKAPGDVIDAEVVEEDGKK